jgi:hypothetical protein
MCSWLDKYCKHLNVLHKSTKEKPKQLKTVNNNLQQMHFQ